jgi:GH25 family lysozyme M1 (1,4-beta-N-acetylmuramidase)
MEKRGIDISRYQGKPDFAKVKNEVDYVIVQAGYGRYASQKDSEFERTYAECKKKGGTL